MCAACHDQALDERRRHFDGERALRRLSTYLYLLALAALVVAVVGTLIAMDAGSSLALVIPAFGLAVVAGSIATGRGLDGLRPWARVPCFVLAVAVLPLVPLGTLFGVHTLWVLARHGT